MGNLKQCPGRAEEPVSCAGDPTGRLGAASGKIDTEGCPGRTGGNPGGKGPGFGRARGFEAGGSEAGDTGPDAGFFVTDRMRAGKEVVRF